MHVIHVLERDERMQRRIDGASPRIKIKSRMGQHPHHFVFARGLRPSLRFTRVQALQVEQLLLVQRRKILPPARSQVAAGTLHPEHFHIPTRQGILLDNLGRGIAATGVRDAQVAAQDVRSVDQPPNRVEL